MFSFKGVISGIGKRSGEYRTIVRTVEAETFRKALGALVEKSLANFNKGATIVSLTRIDD